MSLDIVDFEEFIVDFKEFSIQIQIKDLDGISRSLAAPLPESIHLVSLFAGTDLQHTFAADLEEVSHISSRWIEAGGTAITSFPATSFEVRIKNETYDVGLSVIESRLRKEVFTSLAEAIASAKAHLESVESMQIRWAEAFAQCELAKPVRILIGSCSTLPEYEEIYDDGL